VVLVLVLVPTRLLPQRLLAALVPVDVVMSSTCSRSVWSAQCVVRRMRAPQPEASTRPPARRKQRQLWRGEAAACACTTCSFLEAAGR
jgi:hypothetical protein